MSLSLVQDYSSEEEKGKDEPPVSDDDDLGERELRTTRSNDVHDVGGSGSGICLSRVSEIKLPKVGSSLLPSPEDLFSEVTGPPEFLKSSATEPLYTRANDSWQPSSGQPFTPVHRSDQETDSGPGVVLATNAKSSGLHEQVQAASENGSVTRKESGRLAAGVGAAVRENISASPRLYIGAEKKPITDVEKRNRSKTKDKEKNKRMKGQSSHATWKSETEMHLRQQFD